MLTLTLQADSYLELAQKAAEALNLMMTAEAIPAAAVTAPTKEFADAVATNVKAEVAAETTKKTRGKAAAKEEEAKPLISTGEPREDPTEKPAETGNGAAPALTHQDIRDLMGSYANTFGMKAVQTDGPVILSRLFGEGKVRASDIPDNPEALKKAFDALNKAIETNEFKRALAS